MLKINCWSWTTENTEIVSKIRNIRSKSAESFEGSDSLVRLTHSLRRTPFWASETLNDIEAKATLIFYLFIFRRVPLNKIPQWIDDINWASNVCDWLWDGMWTLKLDISHIRIVIIGLAGEFRVNTELFSYAKLDIFYSIKFIMSNQSQGQAGRKLLSIALANNLGS